MPQIIEAGQWSEFVKELPEVPFLMDQLIPRNGKTILHGPPGSGKSAFLWGVGNAVSQGVPYLGFKTLRTRTLLISVDMNAYELNTRWGKSFDPCFDLIAPPKFDCTSPAFIRGELYKQVNGHMMEKQVGLVMIDAIGGTHLGRSAMDDDTATAVDAAISAWLPGCAILMLAHDRKVKFAESGRPIRQGAEGLLGSQMWRSNCTNQLHMENAGNNASVIYHEKCQVGPKYPEPIRVYIDEFGNCQLWGKAQAQECHKKYQDAVDLLGIGGLKATERNEAVAKYYQVDIRTVRRWCAKFREIDDES